jgi:hypothetical protein
MSDFITQKECLERGGHHWNYYSASEKVDKYGKKTGVVNLVLHSNKSEYRKCGLCGKEEVQQPSKWEEVCQ